MSPSAPLDAGMALTGSGRDGDMHGARRASRLLRRSSGGVECPAGTRELTIPASKRFTGDNNQAAVLVFYCIFFFFLVRGSDADETW